jgi:hypothetical protein
VQALRRLTSPRRLTTLSQVWATRGAADYRGGAHQHHYDATGTVVEQDNNNGHSVNVATSSTTNFTFPTR